MSNIQKMFELASPWDVNQGIGWYQSARAECLALAEWKGFDPQRVVWAVAALSPQLKWEKNIAAARAVLSGRISFAGVYSSNIEKAVHILFDATDWERWLSGPKVTSFAANIWGNPDIVTVDTWAWRIWAGAGLFDPPKGLDKNYDRIADDYRVVARQVNLEPRQLQAVTWITVRRIANRHSAAGQLSLAI